MMMADARYMRAVIDLVKLKWRVEIIVALSEGPMRWTDLVTTIGQAAGRENVHDATLNRALDELEECGLIDHHDAGKPVYALSSEGEGLIPLAQAVAEWGKRHPAVVRKRR